MIKTRLFRFDLALLLALALCAFSLIPLVARPGLPNGTDVLYHVYRAGEMDRSWAHGVLLPRWAEGMYYGYGSPLFHYYASASYYITSLLSRLLALDAVNSLRALIVLCMLGGGAGMYLFMKQRAGTAAGIVAALVYIYSPYLLYTEPYARGDYPELLAFAMFPALMWRFERLLATGRGRDALWAALCVLLLVLSHNLMALVLFGLLAAWLVWTLLSSRDSYGLRAVSAAGIGVGLAAYFWLPVLLEQGAVKLENLTASALLDYRNFFMQPAHLLAAVPRADAGALNGLLHLLNLGVAQWTLALAGAAALVWRRRAVPDAVWYQGIFFALAGAAFIVLMLPSVIWEIVTPLALLQFPWRFLGPAAFCLAVLAGFNSLWLARLPLRWGQMAAAGGVVWVIGWALPMLYVPEWVHETVDASISGYHQSEVSGLQQGTTFTNEYLPRTVAVLASSTNWLLEDYAAGYPVNKANRARIPEGASVEVLDHGPQHDVWRVVSGVDFVMEVLTHDFPGWRAEVNGQAVPVSASDPHGFIHFPVPAGEHTVRVYLGSTPARDLGMAITAAALLSLAGLAFYLRRRETRPAPQQRPQPIGGFVAGGVLSVLVVALGLREGVAWLHSAPGEALPAQHQAVYALSPVPLRFLGYDLSASTARPGDTLELVVYWHASGPIAYNYQSFVHVSDGGPPLAQADKQNPAGRPTSRWTADGYIRDEYSIHLPESMPPGRYQLLVGLYTCETLPVGECGNGDRLVVHTLAGDAVGDAVPLGMLDVR